MTTPFLAATALFAGLVFGDPAWAETISPQSGLYAELSPHFRDLQHEHPQLVVRQRRRVDASTDAIVVEATAEFAMPMRSLGVFVVERHTGRRRFTVEVFPAELRPDVVVEIRDVTVERITLTRRGGSYGRVDDALTYFWDLDAGAVRARVVHGPFAITDIVQHEGAIWAVGSDGRRGGIVRVGARGATPAAEVVESVGGQAVPPIHEMTVEDGALVLLGATTRLVLRDGRWETSPNPGGARLQRGGMTSGAAFGVPAVRFWVPEAVVRRHLVSVGLRKFLVWARAIRPNAYGGPAASGIWEIDGEARFHAMPAPPYETFRKMRPERVADGYTRDDTELATEIGPIQVEGRHIWFGTAFYDGEGTTGIGGIGSFDVETRRWQLVHPVAVADWSSSAILVEPDAVWLGLVQHTEGRGRDGGLVRWNRRTGETRRVPMAGINVIRRFGRLLYVGAADGLFIVDGAKVTHTRVIPRLGGGLERSPAVGDRIMQAITGEGAQ